MNGSTLIQRSSYFVFHLKSKEKDYVKKSNNLDGKRLKTKKIMANGYNQRKLLKANKSGWHFFRVEIQSGFMNLLATTITKHFAMPCVSKNSFSLFTLLRNQRARAKSCRTRLRNVHLGGGNW